MPALATSSPDTLAGGNPQRFSFVANTRPFFRGAVGGITVLALGFAWFWWTGRLHPDATFVGIVVVSFTLVPPFTVWRQRRHVAASLGLIEIDDDGVRWQRPDGTMGFNVPWREVSRATVDSPNFTVVLLQRDSSPVLIGAISQYGVPSGTVILQRFGEIVEVVSGKVPTSPHGGSRDPAAARRMILVNVAGCLTAMALYLTNVAIAGRLHWTRWLVPMPGVIAALRRPVEIIARFMEIGHVPERLLRHDGRSGRSSSEVRAAAPCHG
jgi:hypothetical protein